LITERSWTTWLSVAARVSLHANVTGVTELALVTLVSGLAHTWNTNVALQALGTGASGVPVIAWKAFEPLRPIPSIRACIAEVSTQSW
jgi:hypothetical protein